MPDWRINYPIIIICFNSASISYITGYKTEMIGAAHIYISTLRTLHDVYNCACMLFLIKLSKMREIHIHTCEYVQWLAIHWGIIGKYVRTIKMLHFSFYWITYMWNFNKRISFNFALAAFGIQTQKEKKALFRFCVCYEFAGTNFSKLPEDKSL